MSNVVQFPTKPAVTLPYSKFKDLPQNADFAGRFYIENGRLGFAVFPTGKVSRLLMAAMLRRAAVALERGKV